MHKAKTVNCYVDGDYLCDAVETALRNDMMLNDAKFYLKEQYTGHDVKFVVEEKAVKKH